MPTREYTELERVLIAATSKPMVRFGKAAWRVRRPDEAPGRVYVQLSVIYEEAMHTSTRVLAAELEMRNEIVAPMVGGMVVDLERELQRSWEHHERQRRSREEVAAENRR